VSFFIIKHNPANIPAMKKFFTLIAMTTLLTGCASTLNIDRTYSGKLQDSRARFLVIHYTVSNLQRSIELLTGDQVSVHYLVTDEAQPRIYGMVDENKRAWHAGKSEWKDYKSLGASSIGIEIVNPGYTDTAQGRVYAPFPQKQMDVLLPLIKDIVARNQIAPENILGHSDIAPQRKQDPGPMFPWKQLADAGLIIWPDAEQVKLKQAGFEGHLPDIAWFQKKLHVHGFAVPQTGELDAATQNVISVFQMKYRPANIDGKPDAETAAILEVLTTAPSTIGTPFLEQTAQAQK